MELAYLGDGLRAGTGLKTITNFQEKQYTIMPFNLGWCDGEEKIYAERTVQIRFKQKPTAGYTPTVTRTFTIKQNAHTDIGIGNNTFFQWGRKDPFVELYSMAGQPRTRHGMTRMGM